MPGVIDLLEKPGFSPYCSILGIPEPYLITKSK